MQQSKPDSYTGAYLVRLSASILSAPICLMAGAALLAVIGCSADSDEFKRIREPKPSINAVTSDSLVLYSESFSIDSHVVVEMRLHNRTDNNYLVAPGIVFLVSGDHNYLSPSYNDCSIDMYANELCPGAFDTPMLPELDASLQFVELTANDSLRCTYFVPRSIHERFILGTLDKAYIGSVPVWSEQSLREVVLLDPIRSNEVGMFFRASRNRGASGGRVNFVVKDQSSSILLTSRVLRDMMNLVSMRIYNAVPCR